MSRECWRAGVKCPPRVNYQPDGTLNYPMGGNDTIIYSTFDQPGISSSYLSGRGQATNFRATTTNETDLWFSEASAFGEDCCPR